MFQMWQQCFIIKKKIQAFDGCNSLLPGFRILKSLWCGIEDNSFHNTIHIAEPRLAHIFHSMCAVVEQGCRDLPVLYRIELKHAPVTKAD